MPEWVVPKAPKVWNMQKRTAYVKECMVQTKHEQDCEQRRGSTNESNGKAPCVQKRTSNQQMSQRSMISAKRMNKLLRRGADVHLAVIIPSSIQGSGVTQKVKQQIMKEKGPI